MSAHKKPLRPPNPDPLAELRARGLVDPPTRSRDDLPPPRKVKLPHGTVTEFVRR